MNIAIVEDEVIWRNKIQTAIVKHCKDKNISNQIFSYASGEEFLKNADVDMVFLDIELAGDENGFEIAMQLMHFEKNCKVCFLTSHTELARQGYKVNAFRYIDKKHLEEISEAVDFFLETRIQDTVVTCKDITGINVTIPLNKLLLIETFGRKLRYLMLDGREYICDGRISEAAMSLSQFGFYQIQRSYIVNLKHIEKADSREIILRNGLAIRIGRTHSKDFKKEFFEWRMRFNS